MRFAPIIPSLIPQVIPLLIAGPFIAAPHCSYGGDYHALNADDGFSYLGNGVPIGQSDKS